VFDTLSDRLQGALGDLRGRGKLDEEAISRAMREIRLALLEADVNFEVVKQFVAQVRERALGQEVLKSLQPGQQVVKAVHDELTALMGSGSSQLAFTGRPPTVILLAGLQGSGKTTAAAKLALLLRKEGRSPGLVAADLQRPAAIDQLEQLGKQIQVPVYRGDGTDPVAVVHEGVRQLTADGVDTIILDTAGRLHVDEELMQELERVGSTWLVTEHECSENWPSWEIHPNADEFVYLIDGAATLLLEQDTAIGEIHIVGGNAVVVPKGTWHTLKTNARCRMLFVTMGAGTRNRPA